MICLRVFTFAAECDIIDLCRNFSESEAALMAKNTDNRNRPTRVKVRPANAAAERPERRQPPKKQGGRAATLLLILLVVLMFAALATTAKR